MSSGFYFIKNIVLLYSSSGASSLLIRCSILSLKALLYVLKVMNIEFASINMTISPVLRMNQ